VPRTQTQIGNQSFAAAGPWQWNNLPVELGQWNITSIHTFKRLLKKFLLGWRCDALWLLVQT